MNDNLHVKVGTIGHIDHSKTTLTQTITKLLAIAHKVKAIDTSSLADVLNRCIEIDNDPAETSVYARLQKEQRTREPRRSTGAAQAKRQAKKRRHRR